MFLLAFGTDVGEMVSRDDYERGRMPFKVHGNLAQDDYHDDGANSVTWDLIENQISKEGILRSFRAVVGLFHRPNEPFWMDVSVKPVDGGCEV